jgi:flagellar hook assembly protein FlgD
VEDASVRAIPAEYALGQNYPNPFNPDTQISYQLPESGEVWLVVYNLLGQEVRVLAQGHQDVGYYRVVWDGKDTSGRSVSSGVYLVRMASGDFTSVKKMLLLK